MIAAGIVSIKGASMKRPKLVLELVIQHFPRELVQIRSDHGALFVSYTLAISCQGLEKTAQRESSRAGYAADVPGSFVRTACVKDFGQALETLEKKAYGCRHP